VHGSVTLTVFVAMRFVPILWKTTVDCICGFFERVDMDGTVVVPPFSWLLETSSASHCYRFMLLVASPSSSAPNIVYGL